MRLCLPISEAEQMMHHQMQWLNSAEFSVENGRRRKASVSFNASRGGVDPFPSERNGTKTGSITNIKSACLRRTSRGLLAHALSDSYSHSRKHVTPHLPTRTALYLNEI